VSRGSRIEEFLGQIAQETDKHNQKVAAAGERFGIDRDSVLLGMSPEELRKMAEDIELQGGMDQASERIVAMSKEASENPEVSSLDLALEMQKLAYRQAAQNLGLIPKEASENPVSGILTMLFSGGGNPLEKIAEVAAHFEMNRMARS
jgi:hypothetical protein